MAATSRPDLVDVALLRPGRIDKSVYCGFPDDIERREILQVYLNKFQYQPTEGEDDFLNWLVSKTDGFTSADLKGLIQNAQLAKMSEVLKHEENNGRSAENEVDFRISQHDVRESMRTFVRGMSEQEKRRFLAIYAKYQDKGGNQSAESIKQ